MATPPTGYAYTSTPFFANPGWPDGNPDLQRIMLKCTRCGDIVMWADTTAHEAWHTANRAYANLIVAQVPVITLAAPTRDVVITLTRSYPDTTYLVDIGFDGSLIGRVTGAVKSGTKTTTGFTITVTATVATVAVGSMFVFTQGVKI